ncbi:MAG: amidohydrolase family protein [Acidobacteria bacterium]|nr:amidohydrolase family protein [Acidobacteriota bacterium]
MPLISRRSALLAFFAGRPQGVLIDTHIHLFEPQRFPYHPNATYKPPAEPLESYSAFVKSARIDHTVIIHPEPYQDDHRYLEYCFANEPSPGFFKGTCLYDPIDPRTPRRMEELVRKHPNRIAGLRIHVNRARNAPPSTSGAIRDRDLGHPQMKKTWAAAHKLGLAIQMHFIPCWASHIGELATEFRDTPVILDHLARAGQGTPAEYEDVLKLARLPKVYMKFSGVGYSSRQDHPHRDAQPLVRRAYDAFGPDRMIWGGIGHSMEAFGKAVELFEEMFSFAPEASRAKIRGLNAVRLFRF